jgi:hypothetical protein
MAASAQIRVRAGYCQLDVPAKLVVTQSRIKSVTANFAIEIFIRESRQ